MSTIYQAGLLTSGFNASSFSLPIQNEQWQYINT